MKNLLIVLSFCIYPIVSFSQEKLTLSPLETVHIKESNVYWKAKLDGKAIHTVVNASSIAVMNTSFPMEKNITKQISFKLGNADNQGRTVNGKVTGVVEWNEQKYYTAELEIGIHLSSRWEYRKVNCVLADLSEEEYKLLIGKNWLGDDVEVK